MKKKNKFKKFIKIPYFRCEFGRRRGEIEKLFLSQSPHEGFITAHLKQKKNMTDVMVEWKMYLINR